MTTTQTTQATAEANSDFVKQLNESIRKQAQTIPSANEGINWTGVAKTVGIFALGAVAGAAGKLAYDHFFG